MRLKPTAVPSNNLPESTVVKKLTKKRKSPKKRSFSEEKSKQVKYFMSHTII